MRAIIATTVAVAMLVAASVPLGAPVKIGFAQPDEPPQTAADRVSYLPWLGEIIAEDTGDSLETYWPELRVQNGGRVPTRFMAVYFPTTSERECAACRVLAVSCSEAVVPGDVWTDPPPGASRSTASSLSAVVYGLNMARAADYGSEWQDWLAERGYELDATLADVACGLVQGRLDSNPAEQCDNYRAFHAAFVGGEEDALGVPPAPLRGEPIGVVAATPLTAKLGAATLDRYAGVAFAETGAHMRPMTATTHTVFATGMTLQAPDGFESKLVIQNAGVECATVHLLAINTGDGPIAPEIDISIPPGESRVVDAAATWPLPKTTAVRLDSDVPVAAAIVTFGYDTSAVHTGLRARGADTVWHAPLAYQELRRAAEATSRQVSLGEEASVADERYLAEAQPDQRADDWPEGETYVATLNPSEEESRLHIHTQSAGNPERNVIIRFEAMRQTVLQLGMGYGLPGGPGWARFTTEGGPGSFSLEHQRTDEDGPRVVEQLSTPAWPLEPGVAPGRTVAFPDLGGPAIGDPEAEEDNPMGLEARIAVQSIGSESALVAFDGRGICGPAGTFTATVPAGDAIVLRAVDLPGVRDGANALTMRVLEGAAAATFQMVRLDRVPKGETPPVDLSSGYRAIELDITLDEPYLPDATVSVTPTMLHFAPDEDVHWLDVNFEAESARCLRFTASSDAPWLAVDPGEGPLPAVLTVTPSRAGLEPGVTYTATIMIDVAGPKVTGAPIEVPVVVEVPAGGFIYLPWVHQPFRSRPLVAPPVIVPKP